MTTLLDYGSYDPSSWWGPPPKNSGEYHGTSPGIEPGPLEYESNAVTTTPRSHILLYTIINFILMHLPFLPSPLTPFLLPLPSLPSYFPLPSFPLSPHSLPTSLSIPSLLPLFRALESFITIPISAVRHLVFYVSFRDFPICQFWPTFDMLFTALKRTCTRNS